MENSNSRQALMGKESSVGVSPMLPLGESGVNGSAAVWGWFLGLVGWCIVLAFFSLSGGAEFEPTDCWVSQTAREMQEAGDWFVPRFSGEVRLRKSPGPYWAVMLASELMGRPVDKVSVRAPSALLGVVLVLTIFWLTRRIAGDRPAVFAGFAAASSPLFLYWSHRGASDLGLAAFVALSIAALWIALECYPSGWKRGGLLLLGYLAAGLGMLYKMLMPLVCVGGPAYFYLLRRFPGIIIFVTGCLGGAIGLFFWKSSLILVGLPIVLLVLVMFVFLFKSSKQIWWMVPWHVLGIVLFLVPWLPWVIWICMEEPTALHRWKLEFWDRFTGELPNVEGQRAWYFHFVYLIPVALYTIPYTLSLPAAFVRGLRRKPGVYRQGMIFMVVWFVFLFIFFTLAAGKEVRYFLVALPPLFVLLGVELADFFDPRRGQSEWARLGSWAVWVLAPLAFIAGGFVLYRWHEHEQLMAWSEVWPPYVVAAIIFCVGASFSAWMYQRGARNKSFAALVGTMWVFWLWFWPTMMPVMVSGKSYITFARELRAEMPEQYRPYLVQVGGQDSRIIWYSDLRIPRIMDRLELLEKEGGDRSLQREMRIVGREMIAELRADDPVLMIASRPHYVRFMIEGREELIKGGEQFPETYLWLESKCGPKYGRFVIFGNIKPPWPVAELDPPSKRLIEALGGTRDRLVSRPATQSE